MQVPVVKLALMKARVERPLVPLPIGGAGVVPVTHCGG